MPHSAIELYMDKLAKNQSVMRMMLGEAATVPHMDENDRRTWAKDIETTIHEGKPVVKTAPRAVYKMVGIGIRK